MSIVKKCLRGRRNYVVSAIIVTSLVVMLSHRASISNDLHTETLSLVEGSNLNYSIGVEISSLQSMYACITKNLSATYKDFDLNAALNVGVCAVCHSSDIGQKCARQFKDNLTNITVNRLQDRERYPPLQLMNFFQKRISVGDDKTKIICVYEAGNDNVVPYSSINLYVHSLSDSHALSVQVTLSQTLMLMAILLIVIVCLSSVSTVVLGRATQRRLLVLDRKNFIFGKFLHPY